MKKMLTIVAFVAAASVASADFNINTFSSFGIYNADGTAGILPSTSSSALVQLVYAGGTGIDTGAVQLDGSTVGGDDVVVASTVWSGSGSAFEDYAAGTYGTLTGAYQGAGDVYVRIFDSATLNAGDRYYVGHLFTAADQNLGATPPPTPESYDLGQGADLQLASGTVVPEPATIGLLGIAGIGLFAARRKAQV